MYTICSYNKEQETIDNKMLLKYKIAIIRQHTYLLN